LKFENILAEWEKDSIIDKTQIDAESLKIPKLHHKYYTIYVTEKLTLHKLESQLKLLKLEKYEFYTQGHNEDTLAKGWTMPAKGIILKADVNMYMEADKDIIDLSLKIGVQKEKIEMLESIIKIITNRGFTLKTSLDFIKFMSGA
jgi:hypothetical protein